MKIKGNKWLVLGGLLCMEVLAERPDNLEPVPQPPPPPPAIESGEVMPEGAPQVMIIRRGDNVVTEYRLNGHLYAIKVVPDDGRPYYFVDTNGDGYMEGQFFSDNSRLMIPMWVLHRW